MNITAMDPFEDSGTVLAIAKVYRQAFGYEPWEEGYKCPVCNRTFDLSYTGSTCPWCINTGKSVLLVEYWPINQVVSDFYGEMRKTGAICLVAYEDSSLVGFAWGYQVVVDQKLAQHLEAPSLERSVSGCAFYLDETAVLPKYQKRGIGTELVHRIFVARSEPTLLLRTLRGSPMHHLVEEMGGRIVFGISRGRVMMEIKL